MILILPNGFERNYTLGFVRGLQANGLEPLVLSDDDTAPALSAAGIAHVNARGSVAEDRPPWRKAGNLLRYYGWTFACLWRYRGGVVHFTGMFQNGRILFEGLVLNLGLRLAAGRYLYTVHNVLPHGRERSRFFRRLYRLVYRLPHVLLVHTRRARQQLIDEFGVPPGKIRLTSLGLNEEMPVSALTTAEARQRLGLDPAARVILFFGKIDEYKGLDRLLAAFDRLGMGATRLVVAGEFRNPACRAAIRRQMESLRRRGEVQFHERFIPNEEAEVFFKGCDVLCLPYTHIYQSGLVFLAPRFGLPLVTTDVGSLREFVEEGGLGLVSRTNDAAGLAAALEAFFTRPGRFPREEIAARARKYQWREVCRELLPLYAPLRAAEPAAAAPSSCARVETSRP